MSRAYRIAVKESQNRTITAEDHVCTDLEIIEVLPADQMADLLAHELEKRGFERDGKTMVRKEKSGVVISIDVSTGTVTASTESSEEAEIEVEREGRAYDDMGQHADKVREELKKQAKQDIERKAGEKKSALQTKVTDRLEGELCDLREELDQVVHRVTAEALKQKASQMGQIKEITEDPQAGSLTIVVEV